MRSKEKNSKTLWVTGVQPTEVNGEKYIPTALFYEDDKNFRIGSFARQALGRKSDIVNDNFKIELGETAPGTHDRKKFLCADGAERSAYQLANDFFTTALVAVEENIPRNEVKLLAKILVAEPLSFQLANADKTWVQNYRGNIRRILSRYEEVEFLPEPFAVYQYYRYGQRIPQLRENAKNIALVLDFGGGTFDACVIESTNTGDISIAGKHSKPLSGDSVPVGGFRINALLAEYLIKKNIDQRRKADADSCIKNAQRVRAGELDIGSLSEKNQTFIKNFKALTAACEEYKVSLCGKITNWSLDGENYERVPIAVPKDPFSDDPWIQDELISHQFRTVFVDSIWNRHLKKVIQKVLAQAERELGGKAIATTLISGGSSNIRWLLRLLERDFASELADAEPVPISQSFQEVVASGLAIECVRRFYEGESEFVGVTYNPIRLKLNPDDTGFEEGKRFVSLGDKIDMSKAIPGDLIPVALSLNNFIGEPLRWKIKLSRPPKSFLKYEFLKPGVDGVEEIYNAESRVVYTKTKEFDSHVVVELIVSEDGTASPTFIYKSENMEWGVEGNLVEGRPFAIDMTTSAEINPSLTSYIGFDFGTSSSSICMLTEKDVKLTKLRTTESSWIGLSEALPFLPYPVALPLRKYLDVKLSSQSATVAREAFEAALALISYAAAAECYLVGNSPRELFKNFQHRSMGPLKDLLYRSLSKLKGCSSFTTGLGVLVEKRSVEINQAITDFTNHKHEKLSEGAFDCHAHLNLIVNCCVEMMKGKKFVYSISSQPAPFQSGVHNGVLKVAQDIPPFVESITFTSKMQVGTELAMLVDEDSGGVLPLFPLLFWSHDSDAVNGVECYWYDKPASNTTPSHAVKPCRKKEEIQSTSISPFLDDSMKSFFNSDLATAGVDFFKLSYPED